MEKGPEEMTDIKVVFWCPRNLIFLHPISQVPNGIVLTAGNTVKIYAVEIYTQYNIGYKEVEFYGLEDIELLNQIVWKQSMCSWPKEL